MRGFPLVKANQPEIRDVDIKELEDQFKDFLYSQKGKVTNERLSILRTLYIHDGHYSVDALMELLEEQGERISRATMYRTLDLLVQSGLIRKLVLDGQETVYESSLNSGHHDHIICVDCQKIIEFFSLRLEQIQDEIMAQYHLKPVKHVHQLYGKCTRENCPEKQPRGAATPV